MKIGAIGSAAPRQRENEGHARTQAAAKPTATGDKVEISSDVTRHLSEIADRARSAAPERRTTIDQVRQRMVNGYYNQAEVLQVIASNIADDLQG